MTETEEGVTEKNASDKGGEAGVKGPDFKEIKAERGTGENIDMDFLLDIPLEVTVELGSTRMVIRELLQLGQGSVLELPKEVGEPLEVFVNNKLLARGEAVMVNDRFGIKLTDIISPAERLEKLK